MVKVINTVQCQNILTLADTLTFLHVKIMNILQLSLSRNHPEAMTKSSSIKARGSALNGQAQKEEGYDFGNLVPERGRERIFIFQTVGMQKQYEGCEKRRFFFLNLILLF